MDEGTDRIPGSFRSQLAYVSLVLVLTATALIVAVWSASALAAVIGGLGVIWTALALRSGIDVTESGLRIRGLLRSSHLAWTEIEACVVTGISGAPRAWLDGALDYGATAGAGMALGAAPGEAVALGTEAVALGTEAVTLGTEAVTFAGETVTLGGDTVAPPAPLLSVVTVIPRTGEPLRVYGTASTPLDPDFPVQAAAALNRVLQRHRARQRLVQ